MAKLADARDLKSRIPHGVCGFDPRSGHLFLSTISRLHSFAKLLCYPFCDIFGTDGRGVTGFWRHSAAEVGSLRFPIRHASLAPRTTPVPMSPRTHAATTPRPSRDPPAQRSLTATAGTAANIGNKPPGRACSSPWRTPGRHSRPTDDGDPNCLFRLPVAAGC